MFYSEILFLTYSKLMKFIVIQRFVVKYLKCGILNVCFSEFEETLKQMKWPLVAMSIKAPPVQNAAEAKSKMELLFKQLLKLQLPYPLIKDTYVD